MSNWMTKDGETDTKGGGLPTRKERSSIVVPPKILMRKRRDLVFGFGWISI